MRMIQKIGGAATLGARGLMLSLSALMGVGCSPNPSAKKAAKPAAAAQKERAKAGPVAAYRGPSTASILTLQSRQYGTRSGLEIRSDASLDLALNLPSGDSWNRARIGRAVLRQPDGSQVELGSPEQLSALRSSSEKAPLSLPALMPGTSMIIVSAGEGDGGRGRDDMAGNRHFSKLIVSKADASGTIPKAQSGVMQKTGQPLEIRPVSLPMALKVGDQMAVKVYENQSHRGNAELEVHHPDGELEVLHTQANGMAYFETRRAGVHHLVFHTEIDQEPASAQLTFELSSANGVAK